MSCRRRITIGIVGVILPLAGYLCFWPVPIDPVAWTPPEAPEFEGVYAKNDALAAVERLPTAGIGAEDVAVDAQGRVYGGLADGRIIRMRSDGSELEQFVDTHGRPLGLDFDDAGRLIVADARRGLLSVSPPGDVTVLATTYGGVPFEFTNDVDVGGDGTIYFSDASWRWDIDHMRENVLEHRPYGRLFAYEPATRSTASISPTASPSAPTTHSSS